MKCPKPSCSKNTHTIWCCSNCTSQTGWCCQTCKVVVIIMSKQFGFSLNRPLGRTLLLSAFANCSLDLSNFFFFPPGCLSVCHCRTSFTLDNLNILRWHLKKFLRFYFLEWILDIWFGTNYINLRITDRVSFLHTMISGYFHGFIIA